MARRYQWGEVRGGEAVVVGQFQRNEGKDPGKQQAWGCTDTAGSELSPRARDPNRT